MLSYTTNKTMSLMKVQFGGIATMKKSHIYQFV